MLGIPWLGALIATLLLKLFEFFARFLTKKLALVAVGVAVATSLTVAFVAAMDSAAGALSASLPSELFAHAGLILPSNVGACIAVLVSARLAAWAYWWTIKVVDWKLSANL